jgi:hypothetical protein
MSYFDSRVGEGPVWQVVLIMVVRVGIKVDITAFTKGARISQFSVES